MGRPRFVSCPRNNPAKLTPSWGASKLSSPSANNSTIVLGGLISETNSEDASGVPYLNKIPILKSLFGQTTKSVEREELLIFIQPKIVNDHRDLIDANRDLSHRTDISKEAYKFAEPKNYEFRRANQAAGKIKNDATESKKKRSFWAWPKSSSSGSSKSTQRKGYRNR